MKTNKILLICLALTSINCFAIQEFQVNNNAEIDAIISNHDASRISVVGSRISQVKFTSQSIKVDTDEKNGQIFVYPIGGSLNNKVSTVQVGNIKAQAVTGPLISMFVIDEQGRSFNLRLRMQGVPSETILIKPLGHSSNYASTDFTNQVVTIIENMYLGDKAEDGYIINEYNSKIKLWKEVDFELNKTYTDNQFLGSIYYLRNKTNHSITLVENQFWKPDTIAIAIEKPVLDAGEVTRIFVVGAKNE